MPSIRSNGSKPYTSGNPTHRRGVEFPLLLLPDGGACTDAGVGRREERVRRVPYLHSSSSSSRRTKRKRVRKRVIPRWGLHVLSQARFLA